MIVKRNLRNIVIVTPFITFKYRRDWNIRKIFWEFVLTWKAFLHGVSDIPILIGPVIVRKTTQGTILAKSELKLSLESLIEAVAELSRAGIEHKELRHPQYHAIVTKGSMVKILDFERGKLTKKPRNLSRLFVWLLERGVDPNHLLEKLDKTKGIPENDRSGALKAIHHYLKRKGYSSQDPQGQRGQGAVSG